MVPAMLRGVYHPIRRGGLTLIHPRCVPGLNNTHAVLIIANSQV